MWDEDHTAFNNMLDEVGGLIIEYTEPGDKSKNPRAEGQNKIVEAGIQSRPALYEQNLHAPIMVAASCQ